MSDQLSVDEDKLFRALAELELRLTQTIRDALDKKADATLVAVLEGRVKSLEDSRIARAHLEADAKETRGRIDLLERDMEARQLGRRWLKAAVVGGALGVSSFVLDVVLLVYYLPKL